MERRIGRQRYRIFAYDVESHNDPWSVSNNNTGIWLSSFIDENTTLESNAGFYYDIPSFLSKLEEMSTPRWHKHKRVNIPNIMIYVWNLSFEYSFFFPFFLKRGFKFKAKIEKEDSMVFNSVSNKTCRSVWQAEFKFKKNGGRGIFRDLSKIFPGSLESVAKSFGLETQKGSIDYMKDRRFNYQVTDLEREYNFKDTRIIIEILLKMAERNDPNFWKSISAASYSCKSLLKVGWPHAYKPMLQFRRYCPELEEDESEFLRHSVAGGITYAPERWQFKDIRQEIGHLDIHQAHPASAYNNLFPYGKGLYFRGKPLNEHFYISCCHIKISYSAVRLHSVISLIGKNIATDEELYVWDFEIPTMQKCYVDLKTEYLDGYAYKAKFLPWREYYKTNYQLRMSAKKKGDAFEVFYRKLLNNSSYGKFLERGHLTYFENYLGDDGIIDSHEKQKDDAKLNATFTYLPIGSAIPARTRVFLLESALALGWKNIVYFDTDSIFYILNDETRANVKKLSIGDDLGQWGVEKTITRGQFSAPKRYKIQEEQDDGSVENVYHLAGINFAKFKHLPSYTDLNIIDGQYDIQGVKRVRGGTIIVTKSKQLQVQPKYQASFKANAPR